MQRTRAGETRASPWPRCADEALVATLLGLPRFPLVFALLPMPCGRKRKRHKIATHKRKKRLRKNRHKKKLR